MADRSNTEDFGANSWLVEEMYERYCDEPESLSPAWRDFFSDYKPVGSPKTDPTGELFRPVTENFEIESQAGAKASDSSECRSG